MKIILNENELIKKTIDEKCIDKKNPHITIKLLAKYYLGIGQSKKQAIDSINNFFENNYKNYNCTEWLELIKGTVNYIYRNKNFDFVNIKKIVIYKSELDKISQLKNLRLEKVAFVLLVHSKIYNQLNGKDANWVNSSIKDIFSDTKMAVKVKDQGLILHSLMNLGLLKFSYKVDCTNIQVLYCNNEDSDVAFEITDFRNFVYEYLRWIGQRVIRCEGENCGIMVLAKSNKIKYCKSCAKEINKSKTIQNRQKRKLFEIEKA